MRRLQSCLAAPDRWAAGKVAIEQAQGLGVDPETTQKVKDLRARLKSDAVDIGALESEVYDHLFSFFRRYYSEGDFLAKRVYKSGVYAIPYEGEDVTLHWANKDQYYVKTSEYLRDYAFRLRPDDDKKPMRVHFRLVNAAEGEHGNVKAAEGKDRVFILAAPGESGHDFIAEEDGEQGEELVIHFEYRPATLTDWPEEERDGKRVLSSFVFLDTTGSNGGAGFLQRPQQIRRRRQNPRVSQSDARIALRGVGDLRLDDSKLLRISGTASSARTRTFSPTSH